MRRDIVLVGLALVAATGCQRPWLIELQIVLGADVEVPFDVVIDVVERDGNGLLLAALPSGTFPGATLFPGAARIGSILVIPHEDAGEVAFMGFARNEADELLATGTLTVERESGRSPAVLELLRWGNDAGADAGPDGGTDSGGDAGVDLPTVPVPRTPINGDETADTTPTFTWEASTFAGPGTIEYEASWDADETFAGALGGFSSTTSFTIPSPLAVSTSPPVGARYHWRVRACVAGSPGLCSGHSPPRYLDVGRRARDFNGDGFADWVGGGPDFMVDVGGAVSVPGAAVPPSGFDTLYSFGPGQHAGISCAVAGDLDRDGFADLIVGADEYMLPAENGGARVFFGSDALSSPDTIPEGLLTGFSAGDRFGFASAAAGDVNGDGYDDVIVGAPFNDAAGVDAGAAYVFLGGPGGSFETLPDAAFLGQFPGDELGAAVAPAGDVNGDGFHDVIVGARHGGPTAGDDLGAAYVFYGGSTAMAATLDAVADVTLYGVAEMDAFGGAVGGGGDLNGDGFSDVVVGAPGNDDVAAGAGAAYVYFGSVSGVALAGTLAGSASGEAFGSAVAIGGDVNGDGNDDVVVGAPFGGASQVGRVFVFLGGPSGVFDPTSEGFFQPPGAVTTMVRFGAAVAGAGDVNGDGFDDVVVGAPDYSGFGGGMMRVDNGIMYLFLGGPVVEPASDAAAPGGSDGDHLGTSVG